MGVSNIIFFNLTAMEDDGIMVAFDQLIIGACLGFVNSKHNY